VTGIPVFGSWGLYATGLTSLVVGVFVLLRNPQRTLNRVWFRFSMTTALWAFTTGLMAHAPNVEWASRWARTASIAFSFIPAFFLHFSLILANDKGKHERLLRWTLRIAGIFALLSLTPLMMSDLQAEFSFRYYPVAGPFYGIFALWFFGVFLASLSVLLKAYRVQVGYKRNQLRYVIGASVMGLASFLSMTPLTFGIAIPPIGQGLLIFYALISYAIIRWRLMDISIVIKNTLIYAGFYSILVGLFVVVVVFMGQWFFYGPQALDKRVLWMCAVALSIVTALVRPLDAWLTRLTDRLLFQRKYDWQKTLKEASKGMSKITSAEKLLKLMAHFIGMRIRVTHVGILYRSSDHYTLKVSRGRERKGEGLTVGRDNALAAWLEEKKEALTQEEVQRWQQQEKLFPHRTVLRRTLAEIQAEMDRLGAQVCVPALSRSQMIGVLILGEKLSGDPYSQEDLDVLSTLANEGAIALENAHLYEQLFERMRQIEDLYQREHRLFVHTSIALASAVDARDPYTHGHTERCTEYAIIIAEELGTHPEITSFPRFKETLKIAALLHDIGKIGVSDEILRKKGRLTPREMGKMREHPLIGAIILQPIKGMEEVAGLIKAHHERYDGNGYPDGLRGTEIPFATRIISVADTFDTMITDRPYRKRLPDSAAVDEIQRCSGTQFDPVVVQAFLRCHSKGLLTNRPVEAAEMFA